MLTFQPFLRVLIHKKFQLSLLFSLISYISFSDIVKMIDEFNGGCFIVNFTSFFQEFVKHHICSITRERFGVKCHRIFAIVLNKKMIEQKQVSELAMVPFKDAKELLYKLYSEGTWIISLIPVQKINNFYIPDIYIFLHRYDSSSTFYTHQHPVTQIIRRFPGYPRVASYAWLLSSEDILPVPCPIRQAEV